MSRKLPFVGRIFWKVFVVVTVLVVAAWYLIPRFTGYKIEPQDYGGSGISAVIFSYLVHLWLLPEPVGSDSDETQPPEDPTVAEDLPADET